jgi:hypothetical protein
VHITVPQSLRLRTIIVQLVTIKVIPDRLHGVYQLQQDFNECCKIQCGFLQSYLLIKKRNIHKLCIESISL